MRRELLTVASLALALSVGPKTAAADDFVCTEVLGVSVTGDWFGAGFEKGIDDGRWQVRWRSKAFVELWADPASDLWALPPESACTKRSDDPDRVVFTAVNWEWKTREEWESRLEAAVATIRAKRPGARRLELMTMLRGPGNQTCGSEMTVVQPYVDQAIAAVAARHPGLVTVAPKVFLKTCEPFLKGGPHYTDTGMAVVAQAYREQLAAADAPERAEPATMSDEQQIRQAIAQFVEAYNAGDADHIASYYADDLVKLRAGAPAEAKDEAVRRVRDVLARFQGHLEVHNDEITVAGSMAFTRGRLLITLTPRAAGTPQTIERRYLEVWRKDGGRWRVIRTMDNAG
jgi:ketosteroid isomerase-like protein